MRILIAGVLIALSGCAADPVVSVRNTGPSPIFVAPACWQECAQSPTWVKLPDGSGDWDALGADQAEIESQKAACEASRQACADALRRLEAHGVIVTGGTK